MNAPASNNPSSAYQLHRTPAPYWSVSSVAFTPARVTNAVAWVDPSGLVGADGTALTSWPNKINASNPFEQATAGDKPTIKTNIINGYSVARYDGVSDCITAASGGELLGGDFYMAAVMRFNGLSGYQNIITFGDAGVSQKRRSMLKFITNNKLYFIGEFADRESTQTLAASTNYLIEIKYVSGIVYFWVNGVEKGFGGPSAGLLAFASNSIRLGSNKGGSEFLNGDIAEAFLAGALVGTEQVDLQEYWRAKYALY